MFAGYISAAYDDYQAARLLFNNDLLHPAAIMANTCLEKELKARLMILDVKFKKLHRTDELWHALRKVDTQTASSINIEFLQMLTNVYKSRYFDGLPGNYEYSIYKNKTISELDYTYHFLVNARKHDLAKNKSTYELDIDNKKPLLIENNYLLQGVSKEQMFDHLRDNCQNFKIINFGGRNIFMHVHASVGEGVSLKLGWSDHLMLPPQIQKPPQPKPQKAYPGPLYTEGWRK